jgi:ATP-binding cassette subfamily F protein uup
LPSRITSLTADIARLRERLADQGLFARDPAAFGKTAADLQASEADLAKAEEEWLALEILREEIEG